MLRQVLPNFRRGHDRLQWPRRSRGVHRALCPEALGSLIRLSLWCSRRNTEALGTVFSRTPQNVWKQLQCQAVMPPRIQGLMTTTWWSVVGLKSTEIQTICLSSRRQDLPDACKSWHVMRAIWVVHRFLQGIFSWTSTCPVRTKPFKPCACACVTKVLLR